jgi:hypothetical protein
VLHEDRTHHHPPHDTRWEGEEDIVVHYDWMTRTMDDHTDCYYYYSMDACYHLDVDDYYYCYYYIDPPLPHDVVVVVDTDDEDDDDAVVDPWKKMVVRMDDGMAVVALHLSDVRMDHKHADDTEVVVEHWRRCWVDSMGEDHHYRPRVLVDDYHYDSMVAHKDLHWAIHPDVVDDAGHIHRGEEVHDVVGMDVGMDVGTDVATDVAARGVKVHPDDDDGVVVVQSLVEVVVVEDVPDDDAMVVDPLHFHNREEVHVPDVDDDDDDNTDRDEEDVPPWEVDLHHHPYPMDHSNVPVSNVRRVGEDVDHRMHTLWRRRRPPLPRLAMDYYSWLDRYSPDEEEVHPLLTWRRKGDES